MWTNVKPIAIFTLSHCVQIQIYKFVMALSAEDTLVQFQVANANESREAIGKFLIGAPSRIGGFG
jgi:hypothetical protein